MLKLISKLFLTTVHPRLDWIYWQFFFPMVHWRFQIFINIRITVCNIYCKNYCPSYKKNISYSWRSKTISKSSRVRCVKQANVPFCTKKSSCDKIKRQNRCHNITCFRGEKMFGRKIKMNEHLRWTKIYLVFSLKCQRKFDSPLWYFRLDVLKVELAWRFHTYFSFHFNWVHVFPIE